ncbi:hypothetical protein FSP39_017128 [Pinctada imbricata]|uniref:Hexosyltransferase n=1 Tax=Pinctada imbricata TaxID=66713 RepID=A0AA88Y0W7_PINIB|nr:hypothetical protein FSP39_017128 [Pinctada imbricata]
MQEVVRKTLFSKEKVDSQVINKHDFNYVFNPFFRCNIEEGKPPLVVILVKSAFENIKKRNAIRSTWGNVTEYRKEVRLVFLLGFSNKGKENVTKEYEQHKDIVCEDFMDTYWNNTHKMIMGFKWSVTHCSDSKFFFFVDDDYFVNVDALLSYVRNEKEKDLFTGFLLSRSQPYRDFGGKWYVSVDDYPHNHYPPYLAGGAYITSLSVARMFDAVFPYVKYLVIDDAYLGIVAQKLNLKPKHNRKFLYIKNCGRTSKNSVIACHGYGDEKKLISDWNLFMKSKNGKAGIKQTTIRPTSNPHVIPAKLKRN